MPEQVPAAAQVAMIRDLLPTTLGSAQIRDAIAADIRARAVFSARVGNAAFLTELKKQIDALAAGETNLASARLALREILAAVGYTPEEGFRDAEGEVPPAEEGSLQDISSTRRLELILRTQLALVRGRGQQARGMEAARLRQFPAWELDRYHEKAEPRWWGGKHLGTAPVKEKKVDPRPRWIIAGGTPTADGRLIALKGDPIWGELGSSGNFDDALDVDFPPFAFNSGMRWVEVSRGECLALGIKGPNGETIDEWQAMTHPLLVDTQSGIPAPQASVKNLDPEIRKAFEKSAGVEIVEDTATTTGNADEIRRQLEERRAAREARKAERLARSIAERQREYEGRGE
jgi:hypothetical protein